MNMIITFIFIFIILYSFYYIFYRKDKIINSYPIKYDIYDVAQYVLLCAKEKHSKITNLRINCIMAILYKKYLNEYNIRLFNDFEWKAIYYDNNNDKIFWIPKLWLYLEKDSLRDKKSEELKNLNDEKLEFEIYRLLEYENINYLYMWAFYGIKP